MKPIFSLPVALLALCVWRAEPCRAQTANLQIVSTASYASGPVAPASLVSAIGGNLALSTALPDPGQPLPFSLAGTSVTITDSSGNTRPASLLFASPEQINFLLPSDTLPGAASVTVTNANGDSISGSMTVAEAAPGLFSANGSGAGTAVGEVLSLGSDGISVEQPVGAFDASQKAFVPVAVDVSGSSAQEFLFLYGTGIRNAGSVEVTANGKKLAVLFAGPESDSPGLDQVNVELPASLAGAQSVDLVVTADGQASNAVSVTIK